MGLHFGGPFLYATCAASGRVQTFWSLKFMYKDRQLISAKQTL
jgi:hypothetical protein